MCRRIREKKNALTTKAWKVLVGEWEKEQDRVKAEKTRPQWKKPIQGSLIPPQPKPTPAVADEEDNGGRGDDNEQGDKDDEEPEEDDS